MRTVTLSRGHSDGTSHSPVAGRRRALRLEGIAVVTVLYWSRSRKPRTRSQARPAVGTLLTIQSNIGTSWRQQTPPCPSPSTRNRW